MPPSKQHCLQGAFIARSWTCDGHSVYTQRALDGSSKAPALVSCSICHSASYRSAVGAVKSFPWPASCAYILSLVACVTDAWAGWVGAQYMHIPIRDQCNWLRERIETAEPVRTNPPIILHRVQHAFPRFTERNDNYLRISRAQLHPNAYA